MASPNRGSCVIAVIYNILQAPAKAGVFVLTFLIAFEGIG
jgi:hypothetical protein